MQAAIKDKIDMIKYKRTIKIILVDNKWKMCYFYWYKIRIFLSTMLLTFVLENKHHYTSTISYRRIIQNNVGHRFGLGPNNK